MKIVPIYDRVIVKVVKESSKTEKGVLLPDSMQKKPKYQVVSISQTCMRDGSTSNIPFNVGDFVFIDQYAGFEISEGEEKFLIIAAEDVIAYEIN